MSSHKENMVSFSFTSSLWFKSHLLNNDYKIEVGVAVSGLTILKALLMFPLPIQNTDSKVWSLKLIDKEVALMLAFLATSLGNKLKTSLFNIAIKENKK